MEGYASAIAVRAGSAVGALASSTTTWMTLNAPERANKFSGVLSRREFLYNEIIEEASKLLTDALTHNLEDPSKFVRLYALISKFRLFASANVLAMAEVVMDRIREAYRNPEKDVNTVIKIHDTRDLDVLRKFSEACRQDLDL